jgi:hypothetical protein
MRGWTRTLAALAVGGAVVAASAAAAVSSAGRSNAAAASGCALGSGPIKHLIYLQFDNTHYRRDNPNVPSDLEQMPNLLNFLTSNGTLFTNDHTILISHTAGGIISTLTGLYPDRNGVTVSNSYDYYRTQSPNAGLPTNTSAFKYWSASVDGADDSKPNLVTDNGLNTPAPWVPFTRAGCDVGGVSTANIELENNNAIILTSLTASTAAGATTLPVSSINGFAVGKTLTIDVPTSPTTETTTITGVNSSPPTLTVSPALTNAHASGTKVYVTDPAGDLTKVYGEGSLEWNEGRDSQLAASGTAARAKALTDFVGIAIHCGNGTSSNCAGDADASLTRSRTSRAATPASRGCSARST